MQAEVLVAKGPAAGVGDLRAAMTAARVVSGVDEDEVACIGERLADESAELTAVIARGRPAVDGEDGRLEGELLGPKLAGTPTGHGGLNYRERRALRPVSEGDVVAEVVPPTNGQPGEDVTGRALPAKDGVPCSQQPGEGVRAAGSQLLARLDGALLLTERVVDVTPLVVHAGDVDYDCGNLHTNGALLLQGDICSGFLATSGGDMEVTGAIECGGATSSGSVFVAGGILGDGQTVRAEGDITCHHATSARLVCRQSIHVSELATQSHMQAGAIALTGGKGAVRGGDLRARESIDVKQAGAEAGTETTLAVAELLDERVELARRSVQSARTARASQRGAGKDARDAVRAGDAERRERLRLRERELELMETAEIRIHEVCHPGVVIMFGSKEFRPVERLGPSTFRYNAETKKIVRVELRGAR